jgi:hypothetical protein
MNTAMASGRQAAEAILAEYGIPVRERQVQKQYTIAVES